MPTDAPARSSFLGIRFDRLDLEHVVALLAGRTAADRGGFLVTPNVDHVVRAQDAAARGDDTMLALYRAADWCLCDSRVLARLARLRGVDLPVVPGSTLTERLLDEACRPGDTIAIVGGTAATAARLAHDHPRLAFVQHRPPMGLRTDPAARRAAAGFVTAAGARYAFIAVGSPQQEMIAHDACVQDGAHGTILCVGASLDFLTGVERRAPAWVQRASLEWAYRLAQNPARMWRRYLVEGPRIFSLAWHWRGDA